MKRTVEYLDALKKRLDLPSDYAAAKVLGVTRQAVSKYRNGISVFDENTAIRAAELLGLDPLEVIAACKAESAPDLHIRRVWENAWGKATGAVATTAFAACIVGLAAAPSPARSAPSDSVISASVHVMSNQRGAGNHPPRGTCWVAMNPVPTATSSSRSTSRSSPKRCGNWGYIG